MAQKGRKYRAVKTPKKAFKRAEEMARRPMPKPTSDMGDRSKYIRKRKYREDWEEER